jgi:hypothetical protein
LTLCVVYTTVFEYKNHAIFNMAVFAGGPWLTLAFGIQTKMAFWKY